MKKGVSLVSIVVIIMIMGILAGIVVISGYESFETINIQKFALELLEVQNAVDEYYNRNEKYPVITQIELNTNEIEYSDLYQFEYETITDGKISLKKIDLSQIGMKDLEYGHLKKPKDVYALSENTGKVYYLLGVREQGEIYYTLTEELYEILNIHPSDLTSSNEIKKFDAIFVPNEVKYTNIPITVKVKLPINAQINSITVTDGKSVSNQVIEGKYKTFLINQTSEDKKGNYTIEVSYTYNETQKKVEYKVDNFDNTPPDINVNETKQGGIRVIELDAKDTQSNIKVLKYAEANIEDVTYFKNYGKTINSSELRLDFDLDYTIYAQDNAGNYKKIETGQYAIYSNTDNSLTFLRTSEKIKKGDVYLDKEITEIYTGFEKDRFEEETEVPWYNFRKNITSVNVMHKIQPLSTAYWFYDFNNCTNLDFANLDTKYVTSMKYMFSYCGNSTNVTNFQIKGMNGWNTSNVETMASMFKETGYNATTFNIGDLGKWDTSKVSDMTNMFSWTAANANWWLDLASWKVPLVKLYEGFNEGISSKVIQPKFS